MQLEDKYITSVLRLAFLCKWSLSAKNWNKFSSQRRWSHQSLINNTWRIHSCVIGATWIIMLNFWLHCLTSSLMHYWRKELSDWQVPFGGPCDLVRSEWKSIIFLILLNFGCRKLECLHNNYLCARCFLSNWMAIHTQTYSICEKLCLDTFLTHLSALLSFYRIWAPNLSFRMTFVQYQISEISLVFKHFNPFWNVFWPFLKCFLTHSGIVILLCFIIIFCNI